MTTQGITLVLTSAGLTAAANLMMRRGVLNAGGLSLAPAQFRSSLLALAHQPLFVAGVVLYGLAALIWFRVLSVEPLSTSYPVLVALTFLLVTGGAAVFFHESLAIQKVAGIGIILLGIVLVSRA
jgi:multidrug transporter EmrE-like cation transporter